ncbi:probable myosin-binding protein 5 [Andrographis paniculata]|uniref:probable myosin-binding protein 5 n=1 Tax=Andrographis paniculata TaxID=175694 RepID=UPI0021E9AC17|nr:probable myosin-binding protein 5 [Andrographis paniculata]
MSAPPPPPPSSSPFKAFLEQKLGELPLLVIYAVLEWVMIILLFVDGLLAFIPNEISKLFDLRVPCLLCTRIDHVLVPRHSGFYYNESMCEDHKKDISSLVYCHVHKKLSDIRSMCQGCLLSFASGRDSHSDKYKSLVGTLHGDVAEEDKNYDAEVPYFKSYTPRWCSCCGEALRPKKVAKKRQARSLSIGGPTSSPRAPSRLGNKNEVELPRVKCREVRASSDARLEYLEDDIAKIESQVKATVPAFQLESDDAIRTPTFTKSNRFFDIAAQMSPRWASRIATKPPIAEPNEEESGDLISRLKRQLQLDQKTLMELQKELDEERSAADVAANNAMAMISRLQAEKAAVQMEALQYQRMMEEQAEYDEEALQMLRDMVLKREEDIKGLESELEMYREKYGQIEKSEVDVDDENCRVIKSPPISEGLSSDQVSEHGDESAEHEPAREVSSLDFEGDRSYLLGLLTDLEKKMLADEGIVISSKNEDESTEENNKATLTRGMSLIKERLGAIEAESGFLKHAAMTLQKGGDGTKLLNEVAQHLRDLTETGKSPWEDADEVSPTHHSQHMP